MGRPPGDLPHNAGDARTLATGFFKERRTIRRAAGHGRLADRAVDSVHLGRDSAFISISPEPETEPVGRTQQTMRETKTCDHHDRSANVVC